MSPTEGTLADLVATRSILLCCGAGGAGKTTTAAAIALEGARLGRRTVVVTIDPARRLADALGLPRGALGNEPTRLEAPGPGELWAVMLDTKTTFDGLVHANARDAEQAERILGNRFYRNISGALSGTQEYMAMEKLYALHEEQAFELVVVDTPPTRHALDFLDAPGRLTRFLDHRLYRTLLAPGRSTFRAVNVAAQVFLRTVARVVGSEALDDAVAFFQAFEGMDAGFRDRAERVVELLADPGTGYVLVAPPRAEAVDDARYFAARLGESGITVDALVVNRLRPDLGAEGGAVDADAHAARLAGTELGALWAVLAEHQDEVGRERGHLEALLVEVAPGATATVPLLEHDVHDLATLAEVAGHLFGPPAARLPSPP